MRASVVDSLADAGETIGGEKQVEVAGHDEEEAEFVMARYVLAEKATAIRWPNGSGLCAELPAR